MVLSAPCPRELLSQELGVSPTHWRIVPEGAAEGSAPLGNRAEMSGTGTAPARQVPLSAVLSPQLAVTSVKGGGFRVGGNGISSKKLHFGRDAKRAQKAEGNHLTAGS